jgi:hypothetical protein
VFARAVNIVSAPNYLGLGEIYTTMLARQHSIFELGGVGGGVLRARLRVEGAFDVADDEPEGKNDKDDA